MTGKRLVPNTQRSILDDPTPAPPARICDISPQIPHGGIEGNLKVDVGPGGHQHVHDGLDDEK